MAGGWTRDGAVLDQINDTVVDGVLTARARIPHGPGRDACLECGDAIPEARRRAMPGAATCFLPVRQGRADCDRRHQPARKQGQSAALGAAQ